MSKATRYVSSEIKLNLVELRYLCRHVIGPEVLLIIGHGTGRRVFWQSCLVPSLPRPLMLCHLCLPAPNRGSGIPAILTRSVRIANRRCAYQGMQSLREEYREGSALQEGLGLI